MSVIRVLALHFSILPCLSLVIVLSLFHGLDWILLFVNKFDGSYFHHMFWSGVKNVPMPCSSNVLSHMFPVVSHAARHCPLLPYSLFILPANSFASARVFSYAVSSSIFPLPSITHTMHFFLLTFILIFFILFTSLRIVFDGSEDAITYQCTKHRNAVARIAPFKLKCAKHSFTNGQFITWVTTRMFLHAFKLPEPNLLKYIILNQPLSLKSDPSITSQNH